MIISINHVEKKHSKYNAVYHRTHATLDDGSEVIGFGKDFKTGDKVESFYDEKHDQHKMQKAKYRLT